MTVGDKINLASGETVPCDCAVYYIDSNTELKVDQSEITGESEIVVKQSLNHFQGVHLSDKTVLYAGSRIISGNADGIAIAVGDYSSAAARVRSKHVQEDHDESNDLLDKHYNVVSILICALIMASALALIQCKITANIEWSTSINIAVMITVYGFPYILAIPAIWDIALRNTAAQFKTNHVEVLNMDSIEEVASLDYLAVQKIGVLDNEDMLEKYQKSIKCLQTMGVKVILCGGISKRSSIELALQVGILKEEHKKVCGAVISGDTLQAICNGH